MKSEDFERVFPKFREGESFPEIVISHTPRGVNALFEHWQKVAESEKKGLTSREVRSTLQNEGMCLLNKEAT